MTNRHTLAGLLLGICLAVPANVMAQGFGIGPHWSFVRGDVTAGTPSTRMFGGSVRIASSRRVVLEASLDTRSELSSDGLSRVRERPLQGSMLLFPVRSTFAPYLLAGYGIYTRTTEVLNSVGAVTSSASEKKTGAHMGFGAEILLTRHAAIYLDYRYRFVKFGQADADSKDINLPGLIPGADAFNLSHKGTMWTSGVAFYF